MRICKFKIVLRLLPYVFASNIFAIGCYEHPWYSLYPMNFDTTDIYNNPVDYNSFLFVGDEGKKEVAKLLENDDFVKISFKRANELIDNTVWSKKDTNLYLVRGLSDNPNGDIKLYYSNNVLIVEHFAMGSPGPVSESPIVVPLKSEPRLVYVWCTGAY